MDADGNGEIDFEEFCACMKKSQSIVKSTNEELIRECFEIFDQDGNGVITENEFKVIELFRNFRRNKTLVHRKRVWRFH